MGRHDGLDHGAGLTRRKPFQGAVAAGRHAARYDRSGGAGFGFSAGSLAVHSGPRSLGGHLHRSCDASADFRAYAFVLAAYTCAIIATSASSAPDHVFEIAMARGTYIVLGVVCEMVAGLVFSASLAVKARRAMRGWLIEGIGAASLVISDVLDGAAPSEKAIRAVFSRTLNLNEQLEFTVVEVGRSDHAVACAYATIGILSKIVSRGLGMQARLSTTLVVSDKARTALHEVAGFIKGLTERLDNAGALAALRQDLAALQSRYDILYRQSETDPEGGGSFTPDDGIILHGLRLILEEYETLLIYFEARPTEAVTPSRFRLRRVMHFHAAFHNAMRSAAAICLAGLVWEVTAWPQGASFISFIAVVVGRFARPTIRFWSATGSFTAPVWLLWRRSCPFSS